MNDLAANHFRRATTLIDEGKQEEAIKEFHELAKLEPTDGWPHLFMGNALKQSDVTAAILEYQKAVFLNPNDSDIRWLTGEFYEEIGKRKEAILEYNKSIDLEPNAERYYLLGMYLEEGGEIECAIDAYEHATIIRPNYVNTQRALAAALITVGRQEEAYNILQSFVVFNEGEHFKQIEDLINSLRMGFSKDWHKVSPEEVLQRHEAAPHDLRSDVSLAVALVNAGRTAEGLEKLHEVVARDPNNANAFIYLGAILADIGREEEALEHMRQAVQLGPDNFAAHWGLGFMLHKYGRWEEAKVELAKVVSLVNKSAEDTAKDSIQLINERFFSNEAKKLLDTL